MPLAPGGSSHLSSASSAATLQLLDHHVSHISSHLDEQLADRNTQKTFYRPAHAGTTLSVMRRPLNEWHRRSPTLLSIRLLLPGLTN